MIDQFLADPAGFYFQLERTEASLRTLQMADVRRPARQCAQLADPVATALVSLRTAVDALAAALEADEEDENEPGEVVGPGALVDVPGPGGAALRRRFHADPARANRASGRYMAGISTKDLALAELCLRAHGIPCRT